MKPDHIAEYMKRQAECDKRQTELNRDVWRTVVLTFAFAFSLMAIVLWLCGN